LCSGISAATVALRPLGWTPAYFAEIDPFASTVLAHHYPDVTNHGDLRSINNPAPVDLVIAGSPCQPYSVTGKRGGLADARGSLAVDTLRLARRADARWVCWENVPGVLSSGSGRDFRTLVEEAVRLGYGVAWRVLDSRRFGLPQSRRRLFLVGHLGTGGACAAAVLADHPAAAADERPVEETRAVGANPGSDPDGLGSPERCWGWSGDTTPKFLPDTSPTLRTSQGGEGVGVLVRGRLRKFTPTELERLQGLPDGYTDVTFRGKPATDRQRLRVIGNTFPVPVVRWIGEGIRTVERFLNTKEEQA
jgi:DNA (cytosine-5)-methyltransferase 1